MRIGRLMLYSLLVIAAIGFFMLTFKVPSGPATVFAKEQEETFPNLEDLQWKMGGTGNVVIADFLLVNQSKTTWKDVMVSCDGTTKNGTRVGHNTTIIFEKLNSGDTKKVKDFNLGIIDPQVSQVDCRVVSAMEVK